MRNFEPIVAMNRFTGDVFQRFDVPIDYEPLFWMRNPELVAI